ncbi:dihydrodipicolinate synthase family protein [Aeromicrobium ginsengisoli]|uniref:Dihydrodipicolinate synthase family protein n=1 Tax=Aeromicrobium ginsengisoli TaxID=363867 RepID=A0A5M4FEI2_9ACTN|nr:dihydrodipicolinate synthase family protein [Aeromicrobium ginsengisoli]KAA1397757.1 dihydrodipicolinate synthase family protein [Aeromicrobium ginsengisoli]
MSKFLHGLIPAALTPFDADGNIHRADLRKHLEYLVQTDGVTGVTVNGHAGEVSSLTRDEQSLILREARSVLGPGQRLVAGVYAHSTREAVDIALGAKADGADVLLVFPPEVWEFGVADDPRLAIEYYRAIAESADLPMIAFVYPTYSALHLAPSVIMQLCEQIPNIVAVKDWSNDMVRYETTLRGLREQHPEVSMLSSYSRSLLGSVSLGADGILSGHASLIPEIQAGLIAAIAERDAGASAELAHDLFELTTTFYAEPIADGFTRMKFASVLLGRITTDRVREPLLPLSADAKAAVERTLPTLRKHARDQGA